MPLHIAEDRPGADKHDRPCFIHGLGRSAAATILACLPEIGTLDRKQAASLAGPVPHDRGCGQRKGRSFVASMRKLVETANALIKADRLWIEKKRLRMSDARTSFRPSRSRCRASGLLPIRTGPG